MSAAPSAPSPLLDHLRGHVAGDLVAPGDRTYDAGRALFYAGLERRPAAVVRPADAGDVSSVVRAAADAGVPLAVRSGGHGLLGHAVVDGGIVLDLRSMRELDLDLPSRTAWVGAGATAGEYTQAVAPHGLATGFGDTGSVGLGGLTLGGGIGLLVRKHGLTIDQLLAAELVTADGQVRVVDEANEPDLFWAVRGGGGNVGVVTRLRFRLHEVPTVTGGFLALPPTEDVITRFVAIADEAPDDLSVIANVASAAPPVPFIPTHLHGQPVLLAFVVHAGDPERGEALLGQLRSIATPIADLVGPSAYADLFPPEEHDFHPHASVQSTFRDTFDASAAASVLAALDAATAMSAVVQLRVLGGAVSRVPNEATAYAHRDRRFMVNVAAMFTDESERETHRTWADHHSAELSEAPLQRYVNFLGDDTDATVRAAYPHGSYERLADIKRRHDPSNLFRSTVNVPPA